MFNKIKDKINRKKVKITVESIVFAKKNDEKLTFTFSVLFSNMSKSEVVFMHKYLVFYKDGLELARINVCLGKNEIKEDETRCVEEKICLEPKESLRIEEEHEIDYLKDVNRIEFSCFAESEYILDVHSNFESLKETEEKEGNKIDELKNKIIKFTRKNGAIASLLISFLVAGVGAYVGFLGYAYERGKLAYWKLDASMITVKDNSLLYNMLWSIIVGCFVLFIMALSWSFSKSKERCLTKIVGHFLVFILTSIYVAPQIGAEKVIMYNGWYGFIAVVLCLLVLYIIVAIFSCFFINMLIKARKDLFTPNQSIKMDLIIMGFLLVALIGCMFWIGYKSYNHSVGVRVTKDGYAIIYENGEYFCLVEYDENGEINKNEQKIVKKDDVEYSWINGN